MINIIMIGIETDVRKKAGHMIKIEVIIGTIKISEVGTALEMVGMEVNMINVIEETLRMGAGNMIEVESGIEIIEEKYQELKRQWI